MIYLLTVKKWISKSLIFLGLIFISQHARTQSMGTDLVFDQVSKIQGLSENYVNAIFQDSRGFLWLATSHGLSRYDGRNFKNYTTIGHAGISDLAVKSITEDTDGHIWFATESGLNKLNPFTEKISQYHQGTGPGTIPYGWINYLYTDKDKKLWLGSQKGVALYDPATNGFHNYPVSVSGKDDRINKFINTILEDNAGKLWITTSYGIKAFDKKTKTYTSYHKEEINGQQLKDNIFYSLFIDHHGRIWAGTFGGELFLFNKSTQMFDKINGEKINKNKYAINDIAEIKVRDNWYLLLATNGGLISFEPDGKAGIAADLTLAGHSLLKIFFDRQHNLWLTGAEGLYKLNPNSFAFKWLPIKQNGTATLRIFHIIPDIKEPKTVFYLTTQTGWYKYNAVTETITEHQLPDDKNMLLKNINECINDGRNYWFTSMQGFGYYDIYNNRLFNLSQHTFSASGQKITNSIVKATETNYWITLRRSGILVYNRLTQKDTVIFGDKTKPDNMYGNSINDMQMGMDGHVWFTGKNKLYRVDPTNFSYKTFTAPPTGERVAETKTSPFSICFTRNGRLLVCSHLRIYEFKNDRLITVYPAKGFSNFLIEKLTEDLENNLWVHADEGVFKTDSTFSHSEAMNNLPGWEYNTSITEINADHPGDILFSSDARLGVLKENLLQKSVKPLPVIINRVRYGEHENYLVSLQKTGIKSSYKDAIEIDLSPVNFIDEKENEIHYRLSGWDNEWKILSAASVIRYEQLPPGDYSFVAKAVNAAGMESAETTMAFTVMPLFYRSWWFISLLVIVLAGTLFLFYRLRLKKAQELERIRARIASDLHDDIGATLSSISLYSQAVKNQLKEKNPQLESVLDKMGENSREMVTSMSDIVWAINPDNDDGAKLISRMESYATDMCAVKNMHLQFHVNDKLNTVILPLEHRKNIYLIFKEAINNAVKYACAANVVVQIEWQHKKLSVSIADDGIGFNEATVIKGNGLKNLYTRAKEIKGAVTIDSVEGKGTTVTLICII